MTTKLLAFITILMLLFTSACSTEHDTPAPSLSDSDITIDGVGIELSDRWVTNGTNFTITLSEMSYKTSSTDVTLSYIEVEKDGKTVGSAKYSPNCSVSVRVDNWNHGENDLKLIAVFTSPMGNVSKEIKNTSVIVFNEVPTYDIEGSFTCAITWFDPVLDDNFVYSFIIKSKNHCFNYRLEIFSITGTNEPIKVDKSSIGGFLFSINQEKTNFDAKITKKELHWRSLDGPSSLPENEELSDNEVLYVDFTVTGTHEGIYTSQDCTIAFLLIRER